MPRTVTTVIMKMIIMGMAGITGVTVNKRSNDILLATTIFSPTGKYDTLFLSNYSTLYLLDELKRIHIEYTVVNAPPDLGWGLSLGRYEQRAEADAALRRKLLTFVVAGGGFSGVELIAELNDFVLSVKLAVSEPV